MVRIMRITPTRIIPPNPPSTKATNASILNSLINEKVLVVLRLRWKLIPSQVAFLAIDCYLLMDAIQAYLIDINIPIPGP